LFGPVALAPQKSLTDTSNKKTRIGWDIKLPNETMGPNQSEVNRQRVMVPEVMPNVSIASTTIRKGHERHENVGRIRVHTDFMAIRKQIARQHPRPDSA